MTLIFFNKSSEAVCQFFGKRGYLVSVVQVGHHRAQQINRQSALQTAQKEITNRIPFILTLYSHNQAVESIILKNFKVLKNESDTGTIFSQPPLISFKRCKRVSCFHVLSVLKQLSANGF